MSGRIRAIIVAAVALAAAGSAATAAGASDRSQGTTETTAAPVITASALPTLTAAPVTGLHELSVVRFNGTGFGPEEVVGTAHECVTGGACDLSFGTETVADATGAVIDAPTGVHREIDVGGNHIVCDAAPETCSVQVGTWEFPVAFATPREIVTVYPTSDLVDGQWVTIAARNFEPSRYVLTTECATADGDAAHCWNTHAVIYAPTGPDGSVVRTGQVVRSLPTPSGTVDCATQTCYLASEDITDYHHRWIVPIQIITKTETTSTTAPTTSTTSAADTLPKTGGSSGSAVWAGLLAVLVGSVLVAIGRRRRVPPGADRAGHRTSATGS